MDLHLTVDSYFEYFLTIFGWVIGNNIWDLLLDTGVFAAPFVAHIISSFLKVREQGDDEGNKGRLLVAWLENKLYLSLIIMMMCCVPLFNVSFSTLKFDTARMKECKTIVLAPEQTGLGNLRTELNGQSARLPLWWAFTYATSKGLTHGTIASIPCKPDLRQIRFEVQSTQIKDQFLRKEVSDFVQECFIPARTYLKNFGTIRNLDDAVAQDLAWMGSEILLNNSELYPRIRAKTPNPFFPWDSTRDANLPSQYGGGYPKCDDWWANSENGLRARLLNQIEPSTWTKIQGVFQSQQGYEEGVLKGLLVQQNIRISNGKVYGGYGSARNFQEITTDPLANAGSGIKFVAGAFGSTLGSILSAPAFDVVKQALPMVQSLLMFAIAIGLPMVIVFSGYSVKAMMTITFGIFAIQFLTFWWEIAYWLDTALMESLYGSPTHSNFNFENMLVNDTNDGILSIVVNTMYLVMPAIWFMLLGWGSVKAGAAVGAILDSGTKAAQQSTQEVTKKATSKVI